MDFTFQAFKENFEAGRTQLAYRWMIADMETPVSAYLKICESRPYSFLLESVEGGEVLGRYSFIGFDPDLTWHAAEHDDPLTSLKETLKNCHIDDVPEELPSMAASGLFGYMGYDMIRLVEDIPDTNPDELGIPGSILMRPQGLVIFDNIQNRMCFVHPIYKHVNNCDEDVRGVFDAAQNYLTDIESRLHKAVRGELINAQSDISTPLHVSSNTSEDAFKAMVEKGVDYIHQGEIFQVVLSQRFSADFDLPAFQLYRSLRTLNPSPFMVHMQFDGFALVASSPEILVRVRDQKVTIRPIAGTRPRGGSPQEDKALMEDLLKDPKELAEHMMLLDLGRNDVGKVSEFGSVNVTESHKIELYSHVMHIISNVEGRLRDDLDIIDAHFSGFPAGTLSGAPKIRAMEIIDELEVAKRSYYAGSMGYFSGNGDMDSCIAIRTALIKDGKMYVQAGGGVVADSNPAYEYQESVNKSKALFRAAEMAIDLSRA